MNSPSFSIVYETENMSNVDLKHIYSSLDSLESQELSPKYASEFLLINSGHISVDTIEVICGRYNWITVRSFTGIDYYQSKMIGASLVTGEIVVFADSDCVYDRYWLKSLLSTFSQHENTNIVAGETSTPIRNLYDLAIAIHYLFPRFSNLVAPYSVKGYAMNNVAFRRDFLLKNPISYNLPLYRASCYIHGFYIKECLGYEIIKNPLAKSIHEPPSVSFHIWRYLLRGRDNLIKEKIALSLLKHQKIDSSRYLEEFEFSFLEKLWGVISSLLLERIIELERLNSVFRESYYWFLLFPLSLPIILWFEFLYRLGKAITYIHPSLLLDCYRKQVGQ